MKKLFKNFVPDLWRLIHPSLKRIKVSALILLGGQLCSPSVGWAFMPLFLGQGGVTDPVIEPAKAQTGKAGYGALGSNVTQWFIIIGALLLVSIIAAIVLIAYSSRHRHRRHHRHSHSDQTEPAPAQTEHRHRKRRHKRRSAHQTYPKNPTLAETGGLPPVRPDDQPPRF